MRSFSFNNHKYNITVRHIIAELIKNQSKFGKI